MKFSVSRFVALVLAVLAANACSESAAPTPLSPASISAASNQVLTAIAGTQVAEPPSVIVKDVLGKPVAGIVVGFTVTSSEGSFTAIRETEASGRATLGGWTLAPKAGINTVVASALQLPSVTFTATGVAGPAAALQKLDGDGQITAPGTAVPISPLVKVTDANGNPVAGSAVTFAIVGGEATLLGTKQISNKDGIAMAGEWKLGVAGAYELEARLEGVPSARFVAHAVEPCDEIPFALNSTYKKELGNPDCGSDPHPADSYSIQVDKTGVYVFTEQSSEFATSMTLSSAVGVPIARHVSPISRSGVSSFKVLLPVGRYVLRPSTRTYEGRGKYSISWSASEFPLNCDDLYITPGADISTDLTDKDCISTDNRFFRPYVIYLQAGVHLDASLATTGYDDGYLALVDGETDEVTVAYGGYATAAKLSVVPKRSGFYSLQAGYADARTIGPITLSVR